MKSLNAWKLNSTLINNTCIKEKVSKEIIKHIRFNENTTHKIYGMQLKQYWKWNL